MDKLTFIPQQGLFLRRRPRSVTFTRRYVSVCSLAPQDDVAVSRSVLPTVNRSVETKSADMPPKGAPSGAANSEDLMMLDMVSQGLDRLPLVDDVSRGLENAPVVGAPPPLPLALLRSMETANSRREGIPGLLKLSTPATLTSAAALAAVAITLRSDPTLMASLVQTAGGARFVVAACMGISAFLQALTGFGFSVVSVGGLSILDWVVNSNVFDSVQPLVATLGAATGWILLYPELGRVKWRDLLPVLAASTITLPVGVALASAVETDALLHLVGAFFTGYVAYSLTGVRLPAVLGSCTGSWALGALAGILGGAFDISGPPLVVHGEAANWNVADGTFKRNVLAVVTVNATMLVAYDALVGRLDDVFYWDFVFHSAPTTLLGIFLGNMLAKRLDASTFRKVVLATCFILGGKLLLS